MPVSVTFNITGESSAKTFTCLTNDKKFINSIINVGKDNTITINDVKKLQNIAGLSGDQNVIEESDIRGIKNLQKDISEQKASYGESWLTSSWDEIFVTLPAGTTMAEVKKRYNLPDGSLKDYLRFASSHGIESWDDYKVENLEGSGFGKVWFDAKTFAKANGLTIEDLKKMFGIE